MRKIIFKTGLFLLLFSPVMAQSREEAVPWFVMIFLNIFGFIFSIIFHLLFSFWGWIVIFFIVVPLVKDRLWMMNRKKSFLHSQKSALLNPQNADARYQLGLIYLKGKNYREAERYFREAISIDPAISDYHLALGNTLARRKKYMESLDAYQETLRLNPTTGYGDVQLGMGNCYLKLNDLKQARYWYEQAITVNSSLAESYYKLAWVCDRLGEKDRKEYLLKECRTIAAHSPAFLKGRNRKWGLYATAYPLTALF